MLPRNIIDVIWTCLVLSFVSNYFVDCQAPGSRAPKVTPRPAASKTPQRGAVPARPNMAMPLSDAQIQGTYILDPSERFCKNIPKRPFYQRISDGTVCCRGKQLPVITIIPETTGECAITTKTDANGILDGESMWCAYTCSLKKLGAIDVQGRVIPTVFFDHLSDGLTQTSKDRIRNVMTTYLDCFKPMKNNASPCHTPLSFQKCFQDALFVLCTFGVPKKEDVAKIKKFAIEYEKMAPACFYNRRKAAPGCCHGKPLPWSIVEIIEAPTNETKINECLSKMGPQCDATCFLNSIDVVNSEMDLDVSMFQKQILQHFPAVKASTWMDYLGPVFLFYDEVLADMGDESSDTAHRVCRFHDRIMELHESKVEQYCSMTNDEVKELIKNNAASPNK
ncbi:unnamed protein product [Orchesella dallaii]|uniref:Uncharacterized protein n=1 Tax=Orchesella dallaii TaxID=48710 RepID=A0ABP1RIH4_9HEXA